MFGQGQKQSSVFPSPYSKLAPQKKVWKRKINCNFFFLNFSTFVYDLICVFEKYRLEKEQWVNKLVVDHTEVKVHKLSASTELKIAGFSSSNQLDKLQGLLKDEPKKKSLLIGGVNFNKIPALSVIKSKYEEQENLLPGFHKGFKAGDLPHSRITDDGNKIPIHNYQRSKFEKLKGHDFEYNTH